MSADTRKDFIARAVLRIAAAVVVAILLGAYIAWWCFEPFTAALFHGCGAMFVLLGWAIVRTDL